MSTTNHTERPLGTNQQIALDAIRRHGYWSPGAGWLLDTVSATERVMRSLARRGLVVRTEDRSGGYGRYEPATGERA